MRSVIPNLFRNRKIEADMHQPFARSLHSKLNLLPMEKKRTDLAFVRFLFAEYVMCFKKARDLPLQ